MNDEPNAPREDDPTEHRTPSVDGDAVHVCDDGPRDAPALVLIHGLGASVRSWDALVPLLTPRARILRVDLPGHGGSAAPSDGRYDVPAGASRVAGALDRIGAPDAAGVEGAVVVGHSTGGAVAVSLAEQRPDLVRGLVLVNAGPGMDALVAPDVAVEPSAWPHLTDAQIRAAMSAAVSRPGYVIPQEVVDDVRAVSYEAFAGTRAGSHDYLRARTLPDRLRALAVPLLVLFGADDRRWRPSSAADYRVVTGARVEMLPGLGHSPILEDPPRVAVPLLEFALTSSAGTGHPPRRTPR